MVYESLIAILEKYKLKMAEVWFEEVKHNEFMSTYRSLRDFQLLERGKILFENFHVWLSKGADENFIKEYFFGVGKERAKEGFPLSEINYALYLEKKVLWQFIAEKDENSISLTPADAAEFMSVISAYFDMGEFFILRGFLLELTDNLCDAFGCDDEKLKVILSGSLYKEKKKVIPGDLHIDALDINLLSK